MAVARVLLLGGSGLLGAPAARALREAGHEVAVASRGRHAPVEGVRRVAVDRTDPRSLASALRGERFDLAVDFLAFRGADVDAVLSLPSTAIDRYVLVSSGQVYLVAAERPVPSRESDANLPLGAEPPVGTRDHDEWAYGVGKREAEGRLAARSGARRGADLVLRLPVVQGAGDPSRRLWAYLQRLLDGGPLLLPGGGAHPVRFIWAEDVARVIAALAGGASPHGRVYNLAQPDEPSLRELVGAAAALLGREARLVACTAGQLEEHGLDPKLSPYSGPWCSRPDPSLAALDLGFRGSPTATWLPEVVRAHVEEPDPAPHPAYSQRAREIEFAGALRQD